MEWKYDKQFDCYCAGPVVYCENPRVPELQSLRIYVPGAYMNADGSVNQEGSRLSRNGVRYTSQTVPIIYVNGIGGYRECTPPVLMERNHRYLEDGYVLVSVGARGKESRDAGGVAVGKSPAALVDLKAGLRWLRANHDKFPGDVDRIVSVGTSAGGAMSSLLGVTGNHPDYLPYLQEIGACMETTDEVFAAQCYCPITNLENADMAYEWMFGKNAICGGRAQQLSTVNSEFQRELSLDLASQFPTYINSLNLGLTLDADGRGGSYYNALMDVISDSVTRFLDKNCKDAAEKELLAAELDYGNGILLYDKGTGRVKISDLDGYVRHINRRMKPCPAFDYLERSSPENQEFGCEAFDFMHFDTRVAKLISSGKYRGQSGWKDEFAEAFREAQEDPALDRRIARINPMNYIGQTDREDMAPHFRIRLGAEDADTSFGISFTLAQALKAGGHPDVDYALIWGIGHTDADYPGEFSAWLDRLTQE